MADDRNSLRTPLGRVRYLGSARPASGKRGFMRLTSLALIPLAIAFRLAAADAAHKDYNGVRAELGRAAAGDHPAAVRAVRRSITCSSACVRSSSTTFTATRANGRWSPIICFAAALGLACVYAVLRIGFV